MPPTALTFGLNGVDVLRQAEKSRRFVLWFNGQCRFFESYLGFRHRPKMNSADASID